MAAVELSIGDVELAWYLLSLVLLGGWLVRTRGGREAFAEAPERGATLTLSDLLMVAATYIVGMSFAGGLLERGREGAAYLVMVVGQLVLAGVVVMLGRERFGDGLRGLGLRGQRWGQTAGVSVWMFFVGTGVTLLTLVVTVAICRAMGYEEIQRHTILETLIENPRGLTAGLMIVSAVIAAPLAEELLFRGVLQSYLISLIAGRQMVGQLPEASIGINGAGAVRTEGVQRWGGILAVSLLFAAVHGWQHAPALFVFSVCLGYVYERYGNLLIPILVHCMFNAAHVAVALLGATD